MATEYASLMDLVLAKGFEHSVVLARIHEAVLARYAEMYPKASISARTVVDEHTGQVRIFEGNKDVTPVKFKEEAESVARQVLIALLGEAPVAKEVKELSSRGGLLSWILRIVFWGYNIYFLFILFLFSVGFLDELTSDGVLSGLAQLGLYRLGAIIVLVATPLLSMGLVFSKKGKVSNRYLARIFFLLEMPVVFLSIISLQVLQKPTSAITLLMLVLLLVPFGLFFQHKQERSERAGTSLAWHGFYLWLWLTVGYVVLLFSFFAPLFLGGIARFAFEDVLRDMARGIVGGSGHYAPFSFIGLSIQLGFGLMSLLLVIALIGLPFWIVWRLSKLLSASFGKTASLTSPTYTRRITVVGVLLWIVVVGGLSYQPNANVYIDSLRQLQKAETFTEKEEIAKELIPEEKSVKQALQDMYDARTRYLFTPDGDILEEGYAEIFGLPDFLAAYIQQTFHLTAYPFVYHGPQDENGEAARAFTYLFGDSINKTTTVSPARDVVIKNRTIEVVPDQQGLFAKVSFEEEYANTSSVQQEVIYEFSLPEHAVVESLFLGPDLEFVGQFAPAGAAQQTYERELRQRRDPALLTQIGPRNYRLRVFPIPGKNDRNTLLGRNQRVKFSYVVGLSEKGYALPRITKRVNVVEKPAESLLLVSGTRVTYDENSHYAPTEGNGEVLCQPESLAGYTVSQGDVKVKLEPVSECGAAPVSLSDLVGQGKKIALLVDVSYPNKDEAIVAEVKETLSENSQLLNQNEVDVFRYNDLLSTGMQLVPETLDSQLSPVYFGTPNLSKALLELKSKSYDLVVVVTGNQKQTSQMTQRQLGMPVYFVTPGAALPLSDQNWKVLIGEGVYTAETLRDALRHYGRELQSQSVSDLVAPLISDYWMVTVDAKQAGKSSVVSASFAQVNTTQERLILPGAPLPPIDPMPTPVRPTQAPRPTPTPKVIHNPWEYVELEEEEIFDSVAAKAVWWQRVRNQKGNVTTNLPFLDAAHDFAQKTQIVTPYTALIALVNDQQQQTLDQLSGEWNRYQTQDSTEFVQPPVFRQQEVLPTFGGFFGMNKSMESMPMALDGGTTVGVMAEGPSLGLSLGGPAMLFILLNGVLIGGGVLLVVIREIAKKRTHQ